MLKYTRSAGRKAILRMFTRRKMCNGAYCSYNEIQSVKKQWRILHML